MFDVRVPMVERATSDSRFAVSVTNLRKGAHAMHMILRAKKGYLRLGLKCIEQCMPNCFLDMRVFVNDVDR